MPGRQDAGAVERIVWQVVRDLASRGGDGPSDPTALRAALGGSARLAEDLGLTSLQVLTASGAIGERLLPDSPPAVAVTDVRSVSDLCRIFQQALQEDADGPSGLEAPQDDELLSSLNRAEERRRRRLGLP